MSLYYVYLIFNMNMLYAYFPLYFEGKVSNWYYVLPINSIHGWSNFKRIFQSAYDIYNATDIYIELDEI